MDCPEASGHPNAPVEAGEFAFGGFQADLEALDFAEPAVHPGFGDALVEVVDDLGETGSLPRRNSQHRAAQAPLTDLTSAFGHVTRHFRGGAASLRA